MTTHQNPVDLGEPAQQLSIMDRMARALNKHRRGPPTPKQHNDITLDEWRKKFAKACGGL